jgi:hypothetical protein
LKVHARLLRLVDDTFTLYVRVRDRNRCRLCGSTYRTQGAHLISRRYHGPRWSPSNCWCLCAQCHARYTNDPIGWDMLMRQTFGAAEWETRLAYARVVSKATTHRLSLLRVALKMLLIAEARTAGTSGLDEQVGRMLDRHERYEKEGI